MLTGHEVIIKRNIYYRSFYRINILIFFSLLIGLSVNAYIYTIFAKEKASPAYFFTDKSGRLIRDVPLTNPVYADKDVELWTQESLEKIFNINYVNFISDLKGSASLFSPQGFRQYIKTLSQSKNLEAIRANRYTVITTFLEPMKVKRKLVGNNGSEDGKKRQMWLLEGKVRMLYVNSNNLTKPLSQDVIVSVVVARESFYLYEKGISIGIIIGNSLQN